GTTSHVILCSLKTRETGACNFVSPKLAWEYASSSCQSNCPNGYDSSGAPSRTTSPGFLSSRNPRKTGARNFLSRVHSANLTSQTKTGFNQCIFRIIDGVISCTHCPSCFDGKSTNGQSSRASFWNFLCSPDNDFALKPVPTLPAKTSFLFA